VPDQDPAISEFGSHVGGYFANFPLLEDRSYSDVPGSGES
jgi:hypothetical protein